jgi:hypothetical protein
MDFCLFNGKSIQKKSIILMDSSSENEKNSLKNIEESKQVPLNNENNKSYASKVTSKIVNTGKKLVATISNGVELLENGAKISGVLKDKDQIIEKILNKFTEGEEENKKNEIYEVKDKIEILKELENNQSRLILCYRRLKDGLKERIIEYPIYKTDAITEEEQNNYLEKMESTEKEYRLRLDQIGNELEIFISEGLKEISQLVSEETNDLSNLSLVKEDNFRKYVEKAHPIYQIAFDHFYKTVDNINVILNKYIEKVKLLKDDKISIIKFAKDNNFFKELSNGCKIPIAENISHFIRNRFGEYENQQLFQYGKIQDGKIQDTLIDPITITIEPYKESETSPLSRNTCLLLHYVDGSFELKYQFNEKEVKISRDDVPNLKEILGETLDIQNWEEKKRDKIKALISDYINNEYHYDDFFKEAEKAYEKGPFFNLLKIGVHLEKITKRDNENHLFCTGTTFLRMKCYEKALFYFVLAAEKYSDLLLKYPDSPYYIHQSTLTHYWIEKLYSRKEEEHLDEAKLIIEEGYPRQLHFRPNFRPNESENDWENIKKLKNINHINLTQCLWLTDERLAKVLNEFPDLEIVNLKGCQKLTRDCFESLGQLKKLNFLDLSKCQQLTDSDLTNISCLTQVRTLNLSYCNQLEALKGLEKCKDLTHLNLSNCINLDDGSLETIGQLKELVYLNLGRSGKWISDSLIELKELPNLKYLILGYSKNPIDQKVFELFENGLKNITHLSLNCRNSKISSCKNLTNLKLHSLSLINADHLKSLEGLENQIELEFLDISYCTQLNEFNLDSLEKLAGLKTLIWKGCLD